MEMKDMKPKVYYFPSRTYTYTQSMSKFKALYGLKKLGIEEAVKDSDKVVIKTHFGAEENTRYLRPSYIRFLSDYVKKLGGVPAVTESCGWGVPGAQGEYGGRANEEEYLQVALKHGFTKKTMGADIFMLDGPDGTDFEKQPIKGKHFDEILVAGRLREFDSMILASHFKGHSNSGFGGAIKNLGIGCVSKGGKVQAHNGKDFNFDFNKCTPECNECVEICPTGAIARNELGKVQRDEKECGYCYMCASVCENEAIEISSSPYEEFIEQMTDNAKGVVEYFGNDNIFYINYAIDITYQCDCSGGSDIPFISDIGVLTSKDPVALDQACIDLTHLSYMNPHSILGDIENLSSQEKKNWFSYIPRFDPESNKIDLNREGKKTDRWKIQLEAAEKIGLGKREYELMELQLAKDQDPLI